MATPMSSDPSVYCDTLLEALKMSLRYWEASMTEATDPTEQNDYATAAAAFALVTKALPVERATTTVAPDNVRNRGGRLELHVFPERELTPQEQAYLDAAKREYRVDGDLEFDNETVVSNSDDGAYVLCWKWVNARLLNAQDE
jgi:hypothetical protein